MPDTATATDISTVEMLQARSDRAKRLLDGYVARHERTIMIAREVEAKGLDLFPEEARVLRAWRKRLREMQDADIIVGHWKYALIMMARGL